MINLAILTAQEATERLRDMGMKISADMLRCGIAQKQFPFGVLIRTEDDNPRCYIYEKKLIQWAKENGYQS